MADVELERKEDLSGGGRRSWWARLALLLVTLGVVGLAVAAATHDVRLFLAVAVVVVGFFAAGYSFLAFRGWRRTLSLLVLLVLPVGLVLLVALNGLVLPVLLCVVVFALAVGASRLALMPEDAGEGMPEQAAPPPQHPFVIMNPRSGGGKVARFDLRAKAEALGAEVAMLEGPEVIDVAELARQAVARGADLLGVAGGDGTQALVAGVAADHDVPLMVISAGTRNHFALDLGLDREDPSTCLAALGEDAVELRVDLGVIAGRTFVNNASFGAYAAAVQSPGYREDKARTTLEVLPDLLSGALGPHLRLDVDGIVVDHPQAVLVSDNPYGMGDLAGLGRRARLDSGRLGVVSVRAESPRQAVGLMRGATQQGLVAVTAPEAVISAEDPEIPVGIDGESVMVPTPVRCSVRPKALRVRVPRDRPGVPPRRPTWNWAQLWHLASFSRRGARR
ncbi:diacylglycerol kinase family protein [Terrabacter sp. NPDC080008]|uniref:diacylglycerol/lipid kinase family protein n=1 Tax=Terrabacter sp. NPDC080008 TaxID=3155176 RepID=UPI00344CE619